jgi:adenine deaminase
MSKYVVDEKTEKLIEDSFTFHPVHGDQGIRYTMLRAQARNMARLMAECCPPSAELTLALRHLQIAVMFGNAAIAIHEAHVQ